MPFPKEYHAALAVISVMIEVLSCTAGLYGRKANGNSLLLTGSIRVRNRKIVYR